MPTCSLESQPGTNVRNERCYAYPHEDAMTTFRLLCGVLVLVTVFPATAGATDLAFRYAFGQSC